jgi:hypothetical protein
MAIKEPNDVEKKIEDLRNQIMDTDQKMAQAAPGKAQQQVRDQLLKLQSELAKLEAKQTKGLLPASAGAKASQAAKEEDPDLQRAVDEGAPVFMVKEKRKP